MAKMFYTLEETAELLGKTQDEVKAMVTSGQIKEFRDPDKGLIFKKEQVDLIAGGDEDHIPLAEDKQGSGLSLSLEDSGGGGSGSGISLDEGAKEKSGISIFDTEDLESADPSAVTQVSSTGAQELTMESVGSGSGLLDLTREGDDTSLGADLLEDVYQGEEAGGTSEGDTQAASGLFESTSAASDVSSGAAMAGGPVMLAAAEVYDGPGSGFGGGLASGTIVVLLFAIAAALLGIVGAGTNPIVDLVRSNGMMWLGIGVGVAAIFTVVGFLVGKKS
jgi:hypothetical protein